MTDERDTKRAYAAAVLSAAFIIAFQVAAKATRNTLFLSSFDVALLPRMVMASAIISVLAALAASRWMTKVGPGRLIPIAFSVSAVLLVAEWGLVRVSPDAGAVVVYLHYGALGAVLISGFWSVVNERFDPRTAKRYIGRIAAGGTVGGLLGGLFAGGAANWLPVSSMLPVLAAFHLICAGLVYAIRERDSEVASPPPKRLKTEEAIERSGLRVIGRTPYLQGLVALVLLVTVSEVLIDYVFMAKASGKWADSDLLRFFAFFYTGVSLLTVVVQAVWSRNALQRLGLTRTVALLPAGAALGSLGALFLPGLGSITLARGAEGVARNGLYRAGYELLFTPVAPAEKRAAKALVDVGVVRLGDIVGSGIVWVVTLLIAVGLTTTRTLLGFAILLSIIAVIVALRLRAGYVRTLEKSLLSRAVQLDLDEVEDAITRTAVLQSAATLGLTRVRRGVSSGEQAELEVEDADAQPTAAAPSDPEIQRILELRSRNAGRVRAALSVAPLTPVHIPHVIPLLAWDEVLHDVVAAVREVSPNVTGQLVDRLLDQDEEFAVRRRLPMVLAACPSARAVDGLLRGLEDSRFEVRYRCGRTLSRLMDMNTKLNVDRERAFAAVLSEVAVDRGVWESHRLLDTMEDEEWSPIMDEMLRDRANRALEHVFTVLALVLPRQPLKIAFRGLHTSDRVLRGTALEYLETSLPDDIRKALWPFLEDLRSRRSSQKTAEQVLGDLLASNQSIAVNLEALRKKKPTESDD